MENNEEFKFEEESVENKENLTFNNEETTDEIKIDPDVRKEVEEKYKKLEEKIEKLTVKRYLKNLGLYSILAVIGGIVYYFIQPFKNISKLFNSLIVVGVVFASFIIYVIVDVIMDLYVKNKTDKGRK